MLDASISKKRFKGMLARVFSDGTADPQERTELELFLSSGELSPDDITEVVVDFAKTTLRITLADGKITPHERARLNEIVNVLQIPQSLLPYEWYAALMG